uniref:Diisopropyl-fluorophosphatase n=1 Tax=synthetic construct TaxID=32630 RepID=UPI0021C4C9AF
MEIPVIEPLFTKVTEDIPGAAGPVFDKNGDFYIVAPYVEVNGKPAGEILRIDLKTGKKTVICKPEVNGYGGIPAGCQCDRDANQLFVADMRLGLLVVQTDGTFEEIAKKDSEGRRMQGCAYCAFDYEGNLWITAPAGEVAPADFTISLQEKFGSIYCFTTDGQMIQVDTAFQFPAGIAVRHMNDGRPYQLIVAEQPTKKLWSYDIKGPAKIENKKVWGHIPGTHKGGAAGMDFDEDNNLLVANWGSSHIEVFGPDGGQPKMRIRCPFEKPSALHFKPQTKTIFVTEHENNAVWKFEWQRNGKKQYCETLKFGIFGSLEHHHHHH